MLKTIAIYRCGSQYHSGNLNRVNACYEHEITSLKLRDVQRVYDLLGAKGLLTSGIPTARAHIVRSCRELGIELTNGEAKES